MANCGDTACNCLIRVGAGLAIEGSGTAGNPYMITLDGGLGSSFRVGDTETVNLTLFGSGTPNDPFLLEGNASIAMTQLTDVLDPSGPAIGDVPTWVGAGADGHWEFQPPPPNPSGSVNSDDTINGDGSAGNPLSVALAGTTANGPTTGLEVYLDSAKVLRAVPPTAQAVTWDSVTDKPTSFPTTPNDFTGILPVSKGGTGQSDLMLVKVGDAVLVDGRRLYTQSGTPTGTGIPLNSLWFW